MADIQDVQKYDVALRDVDGRMVGAVHIVAGRGKTFQVLDANLARTFGEEPVQLREGETYEYILTERVPAGLGLRASPVLTPSNLMASAARSGRIEPRFHTGLLPLILEDSDGRQVAGGAVEVQSAKLGYREDYRKMMEFLADRSTELLMQLRAPLQTRLQPDPGHDPKTIAQRFAFLKALLTSKAFRDALQRVIGLPHSSLQEDLQEVDIRRGFRPDSRSLRQIASRQPRAEVPASHPLNALMRGYGVSNPSVPLKILRVRNRETIDTPENRFVKYTLVTYADFLQRMERRVRRAPTSQVNERLRKDIGYLRQDLDAQLSQDFFREVAEPTTLPLNSPVLQRKSGYRELLQAWLRFSLAARLVWTGGEDVYGGGKRDMAKLYEYWLFFQLLDVLVREFHVELPALRNLITETEDGLGLRLKSAQEYTLSGSFTHESRTLCFRFSYNRTFRATGSYMQSGSWTRQMRPDFTLSCWPSAFTDIEAERQELMVHIHFDAKYKAEALDQLFGRKDIVVGEDTEEEEDVPVDQVQSRSRGVKSDDLLKMHSYRDAIRRTEGAYVLYPGDEAQLWQGFHEILPGIGAFAVRPDQNAQPQGLNEIATFIKKVVAHLCNRANRREQLSYQAYHVHRAGEPYTLFRLLPEMAGIGGERNMPPADQQVLVAYYTDATEWSWIQAENLYILPLTSGPTAVQVIPQLAQLRHLLLYPINLSTDPTLWSVKSLGLRLATGQDLLTLNYPNPVAADKVYAVYEVIPDPGLGNPSASVEPPGISPATNVSGQRDDFYVRTLDKVLGIR